MATNPILIFILLLYYITHVKTNNVPLNDQLDQPTHVDLLNTNDNHNLFIADSIDHQTNEHHHQRRHQHGEKLKYFNYCRYIRNEDCENDKCCHIECAKANLEHNDQRKVCRHNCIQHCQNYLITKYNVKIDVIQHPQPNDHGIIVLHNVTDPNSISLDQKLCCFIDVPENCQRIVQYPYVQCEVKRKSTCGQQCLQKVVDINYQPVIYQPTVQQTLPYQIIYNQPQSTYPNYYYPQQPYDNCNSYSQIPYYQNSYDQYPYYQNWYYQNSYYQNPYYQNYDYQNSFNQNPYYQNSYYQNQYYPSSNYLNQYYPANSYYQNPLYYYYTNQQYPVVSQTTRTPRPIPTTENEAGSDGEQPTDFQNDESNDLPNEILPESDDLSNETTTEAKFI